MQTQINKIKPNNEWRYYNGKQYCIITESCHSENLTRYVVIKTVHNKAHITSLFPVIMSTETLKKNNDELTFLEKNYGILPKAFTDSTNNSLSLHKDKRPIHHINSNDIWQHYKGKQYRIIAVACHPEDLVLYVVYEALYDNPVSQIWHRPLEMFLGTLEIDGAIVPRFTHVNEK